MSKSPAPSEDQPGQAAPSRARARKKGWKAPGVEPLADVNPRPTRPSPSDRLAEMTREHVDALDEERLRLLDEVDRMRRELDRLLPENARLKEALANRDVNGNLATVLVTVGGIAIGCAAMFQAVERAMAYAGAAFQAAGVLILVLSPRRAPRAE